MTQNEPIPFLKEWLLLCFLFIATLILVLDVHGDSYIDTIFLGFSSSVRTHRGICHYILKDGGLQGVAGINENKFKQDKGALLLGWRQYARLDAFIGLFGFYFLIFKTQFIFDFCMFIVLLMICVLIDENILRKDLNNYLSKFGPNGPWKNNTMSRIVVLTIYSACKLLSYLL